MVRSTCFHFELKGDKDRIGSADVKIEAAQSFPEFFIDLYQFLSVDIDFF